MNKVIFISLVLFVWMGMPFSVLDGGAGIREAHAVKPPTVKERNESVRNSDQQAKAAWFGRKGYTKGGKFCECGVRKVNKNMCYYPKQGQYCCHPQTGDCHIVKIRNWNNPVDAVKDR